MTSRLQHTPLFDTLLPPPATPHGLLLVYFAGGGGSSEGIRRALGTDVHFACNHSRVALGMHAINHSNTVHLIEDVWAVDPVALTGGDPVYLAAFSPDCTQHSRSKRGVRRDRKLRGQIWVVLKTARLVRPRIIFIENVPDIVKYGPLDEQGLPIKAQEGRYFESFVRQLRAEGYDIEHRVLNCADYGAATTRERWCLIARRDGQPICWPDATHAPATDPRVQAGILRPWLRAGDFIQWSRAANSALRPGRFVDNTLSRMANSCLKYHLHGEPFVVPGSTAQQLETASLVTYRKNLADVGQSLHSPIRTITTVDGFALLTASSARQGTLSPEQHAQAGVVYDLMCRFVPAERLAPHVDHGARQVVLTRGGVRWVMCAWTSRFLSGRELFDLSGFGPEYEIEFSASGGRVSNSAQVELVGNAVPPPLYEALTLANAHEYRTGEAAD